MVSKMTEHPIIGRQLFDVITSGMYDNPLMIFREYVQNSVDSIDLGMEQRVITLADALISIQLNGQDRSIVITDNGLGLNNKDANLILRSLGCSPKEGTSQRGFRGIGRLGGLAYCDELVFETRSSAEEEVAVISWDRLAFEKLAKETGRFVSLLETIEFVSAEQFRPALSGDPAHFFKVTLKNVQRFHADVLMNVKVVYDYLAQVAPVSYDREKLLYTDLIEEKISASADYCCYHIMVNNRLVKRPYSDTFQLSTNHTECINDVEFFSFKGIDNADIAVGWYAKTSFAASLPGTLNSRGIRVRQGNIEIGDEHFLDGTFTERRFASWQIGEIHILNNRLKPNARRDGFEQSPDYECFLEQANLLGRHLSSLCRKSSNVRIARIRVESTVQKLEQLFATPLTYLDEEHYEQAIEQARNALKQVEKAATNGVPEDLEQRYHSLVKAVEERSEPPVFLEQVLDGRRLRKFDQKKLLKHVAKTVIESYGKSNTAEDILQEIFSSFTNPKYSELSIAIHSS